MAILSYHKRSNEGRGGSIRKNNVVTYRELYVVITDDKTHDPKEVRDAVPVNIGDSYPDDISALCVDKDADLVSSDTDRVWHVKVEYSSEIEGGQQQNEQFRPTEIHWGSNKIVKALDFVGKFERTQLAFDVGSADAGCTVVNGSIFPDYLPFKIYIDFERIINVVRTGNVLTFSERGSLGTVASGHAAGAFVTQLVAPLNTANDPFDPPLTDEETSLTLSISRNEAFYNPLLGLAYSNATNSDYWVLNLTGGTLIVGPLQAKCHSIEADSEQMGFATYARVHYHFEIKQTWLLTPLNAGFQQLNDESGTVKKIPITLNGQPVSTPAPLNLVGGAIPVIATGANAGRLVSDPIYLTFRGIKELPFNDLALP